MTAESKQTVVFIFHKPESESVLVERRLSSSSFSNQLLYPAGAVEFIEENNIENALKRELAEELGVTPLDFARVPTETIYGETGKLLYPYYIRKWQGQLPEFILDKGNPLFWITIASALSLPTPSMRLLTKRFLDYLQSTPK